MQKRVLLNLALLVMVLGLGAIALFKWKSDVPPEIQPLTTLDKNQVQQIVISRIDDNDIVLQKDRQDQWSISEPLQLAANQFRIDSILQFLTTKHYQQLESPVDFAQLGLSQPAVSLTVDGTWLGLGIKSPFNDGRRYVAMNNQAYLVVDTISYFLIGDAALFASLFPLGSQPIITDIKLPNLSLQLQGHRWEFLTPTDPSLDNSADAIQGLIKAWQNLQALSVRRYQTQAPQLAQIDVTLKNTGTLQFVLLATEPEFILALPEKNVQYQIASEQVDTLLSLPEKPINRAIDTNTL
ncbi:DUF4340 domain-containing protein [Candidatus Albibeggiatoa sp. nov. NOAA]|uniref:DUF4340 domain-containing protein n=1 Tax=Candidatus Albibeggiatoa sp. nov. NOAA TaxID=3162724 RepID=UPI0032F1D399|nr:DUF4340 domain-containing protein [Thiotrichaceae bacterium]